MHDTSTRTWRAGPWTFFIAVFAWTWGFWLAGIATGMGTTNVTGMALALLGLLGPMIAASPSPSCGSSFLPVHWCWTAVGPHLPRP